MTAGESIEMGPQGLAVAYFEASCNDTFWSYFESLRRGSVKCGHLNLCVFNGWIVLRLQEQ